WMDVKWRPGSVGDKLRTTNFGTGTRGFAAPSDPGTAVCVLPGTELAFNSEIAMYGAASPSRHKTAIFRQINREQPHMHHDALELPDGQTLLLTFLCEGQEATVLQLPAKPTTDAEARAQTRAAYIGGAGASVVGGPTRSRRCVPALCHRGRRPADGHRPGSPSSGRDRMTAALLILADVFYRQSVRAR